MLEIIITPWIRMICKDNSLSELERFSSRSSNNEQLLALQPLFADRGWSPGFVNQGSWVHTSLECQPTSST